MTVAKQNKLTVGILIIGVVVLVVVIWAWWHFVRSDVERTFYAAIDNSMKTPSVTRLVAQTGQGQMLEQTAEISLSPAHIVRSDTVISGEADGTTVATETVGTPRSDYVRYTTIESSEGEGPDYGEVLNIWSQTNTPVDPSQTNGELYGESTLGVVPLGNLSAPDRSKVMDFIRKNRVYQFEENKVKKEIINGRPTYSYSVTVSPEGWVGTLKEFAKAAGLTQLDNIDPSAYREAQAIELELVIDVWSRQITELKYGGERQEQLSGYGLLHDITMPTDSISIDELQQRLENIQ